MGKPGSSGLGFRELVIRVRVLALGLAVRGCSKFGLCFLGSLSLGTLNMRDPFATESEDNRPWFGVLSVGSGMVDQHSTAQGQTLLLYKLYILFPLTYLYVP